MNIGIIVYSQTGHTLSVAARLQERLAAAGRATTLERIMPIGRIRPGRPVQFEALPNAEQYDALVFGAPVQAFSLALPMADYLKRTVSLQGKKVVCLTTQFLPYPWLGGKRAIDQMKKACEAKGAIVCETGIVNWARRDREQQIAQLVARLSAPFLE